MGKRLLAVALSLALLFWLLTLQGWPAALAAAQGMPPAVLLLGLAGLLLSYLLRGLRIYAEFAADTQAGRQRLRTYAACLRIVLMHNAMVNVMPFRTGEAALPLLLHRHFLISPARALTSLFWFRLQDAFVVLCIALLLWPGLPAPVRVAGIAGLLLLAWALPRWAAGAPQGAAGRFAVGLGRLRQALAESTRHAPTGWLWTLANWTVKLLAQAWLLAHLLGRDPAQALTGVLGAELAAIQPVQGVAGFGTYEAGAAAAMLVVGVPLNQGLAAALVLHLIVIASALAAAALAWLLPGTPRT